MFRFVLMFRKGLETNRKINLLHGFLQRTYCTFPRISIGLGEYWSQLKMMRKTDIPPLSSRIRWRTVLLEWKIIYKINELLFRGGECSYNSGNLYTIYIYNLLLDTTRIDTHLQRSHVQHGHMIFKICSCTKCTYLLLVFCTPCTHLQHDLVQNLRMYNLLFTTGAQLQFAFFHVHTHLLILNNMYTSTVGSCTTCKHL